ncbi:MAG: CNNM domain-containing protein [Planctomycetota bacterium]|nr:CNNM domain-containing protein [Planctomycetota bacterium]
MSFAGTLVLLGLSVVAAALYSGVETGFYSLSRIRVDMEARAGHRRWRLVRWLLRDETGLLITVLIGNNLAVEAATLSSGSLLGVLAIPRAAHEIILTLFLSPVMFLLAEALPKELFRRRPHILCGAAAPFLAFSRLFNWPLARPLHLLAGLAQRLSGVRNPDFATFGARQAVLDMLAEGERTGALGEGAGRLARNALRLRGTSIDSIMVPWEQIQLLRQGTRELGEVLAECPYSRIPVLDGDGRVSGYVHQLEALIAQREQAAGAGGSDGGDGDGSQAAPTAVPGRLRPLLFLEPDLCVDAALARLRLRGQRLACVGSAEAPLGLITLKDLLEEISGDLAGL